MKTKGTAHDIGAGMARISLTLSAAEKESLEALAHNSGLSLNAYLNAIMQEAIESRPLVIMRREIIRENRPEYVENLPDKKE